MKAPFFNFIKGIGGSILRPVGKKIIHPLAVLFYGWYLKGALSLKKRVGIVHHPLYALISRRHLHHAVLIGSAGLLLGHTVAIQRVDEQEFLIPVNAIARMFAEQDEFVVETQEFRPETQNEYVQTLGIRSQPSIDTDTDTPSAPLDAGNLAAIPDALIKPILPTIQTHTSRPQTIQTYVVKPGDTLGSIARAHGLKVATLLWANNLSERSLIHIGQRLVMLPLDGVHYRVKRGDTLSTIAQRYNSDIDQIMKANSLTNQNAVAIGELLIIPGGVMPTIIQPREQQRGLLARVRDVITPTGSAVRASGGFIWPTSARRVTQYFSWRHTGVDIAGPTSNKIYAAASGVVSFAGWARGYGLSVVVDHGNGRQTRYGHSRLLFVKGGQSVSQGETIAMVGSTGRSTGPHLHFEVMSGGRRVNPFAYIR